MVTAVVILPVSFAQETAGLSALGLNPAAFLVQLISFILVFWLLKRLAFKPIVKILNERQRVIDEGVRAGQTMADRRRQLDEEVTQILHAARNEADHIIAIGQKEAREIVRQAEQNAAKKAQAMLVEAEARVAEETARGRRQLEREVASMVADATEAVVGQKLNAKTDSELIKQAVRRAAK